MARKPKVKIDESFFGERPPGITNFEWNKRRSEMLQKAVKQFTDGGGKVKIGPKPGGAHPQETIQ